MKASFLGAGLLAGLLALPALANTPANDGSNPVPQDQLRLGPDQNAGDTYGDPRLGPFPQRRPADASPRPLSGRHGNDLVPPHKDAGGVPDPRI